MAKVELGASTTEGLVQRVHRAVQGFDTPGRLQGLQLQIDLTTPQGRWELLVLAVLLAARVSENIAEMTFDALRCQGLLDFERMRQENDRDVYRLNEVLGAEYRGIVDRTKKAEALFANARQLHDEYGGELQVLYEALQPEQRVAAGLQQFKQIHTRARWVCRSMHEAGLWLDLPACDTLYCDAHVRRALTRLGLVDSTRTWAVLKEEMHEVVEDLFAGDTIGLYRLGRYLCTLGPTACSAQCALADVCVHPQA